VLVLALGCTKPPPTPPAALVGPTLLVLETAPGGCALVERSAVRPAQHRVRANFPIDCPTAWALDADTERWLVTLGSYGEQAAYVVRLSSSNTRRLPPPPGRLDQVCWLDGRIVATTDGPEVPLLSERTGELWFEADGVRYATDGDQGAAACRAWHLDDDAWVKDRTWVEALYEGMDLPFCAIDDACLPMVDAPTTTTPTPALTASLDALLVDDDDPLGNLWLHAEGLQLAWRSFWFEGEMWRTPAVGWSGESWRPLAGLPRTDGPLSLHPVDGHLLTCTIDAAHLYSLPSFELRWSHAGACPRWAPAVP
jgi:hypothetical protein